MRAAHGADFKHTVIHAFETATELRELLRRQESEERVELPFELL
jgi:hypothetical protein